MFINSNHKKSVYKYSLIMDAKIIAYLQYRYYVAIKNTEGIICVWIWTNL